MANMRLLYSNFINTTGLAVVSSGTDSVANLFDRNLNLGYETSGFADDATTATLSIEFGTTTVVDTIILQNINLKQFRIYYDSATANVFTPDLIDTDNSATSLYFLFSEQTVSSIQIDMNSTIIADQEKSIGELYIGRTLLAFERNPNAKSFRPIVFRKQINHEMPDGGVVQYNIADKNQYELSFKYLTDSFTSSLRDVFDLATNYYFVPFPTTTSWDGVASEVIWTGGFDFRHSGNNVDAGYTGKIRLKQTA